MKNLVADRRRVSRSRLAKLPLALVLHAGCKFRFADLRRKNRVYQSIVESDRCRIGPTGNGQPHRWDSRSGAKKGGGGTPPPAAPGTIYFSGWVATSGNSGYYQPMTMKGDGTDKRNAFSNRSPSYQGHSNSRWFLMEDYDWDGPVDEWGIPMAWELYAVNEQNQWIQLTGDPNIHVSQLGTPAWGKDDSFVSYPAWWFAGPEEWNVRGGLFVVDIDWSTGVPVAGAPDAPLRGGCLLVPDTGMPM